MSAMQVAQVQFEADKKLCAFIGRPGEAKKNWLSLRDRERIDWVERGPKGVPAREELWAFIKQALEPQTRQQ